MNGILIINKPKGWTSFDVVAKTRGLLNVKKVGHTGTLDPMATGVLVLCIGRATKLASRITGMDKEYLAEITFGATSTTDDAEGDITPHLGKINEPTLIDIEKALEKFTGTFAQMPPDFSAKKIEGKRAYKLARSGQTPKLEPSEVTVDKIEVLDYKYPLLKIRVQCGKGFYMRSLARDLGQILGGGGYLSSLERTRVGQYAIEQAIGIDQINPSRVIRI
ncbi:MAG: tRNA pseudouridine(55) synthase TruB [Candidatus Peregrinibacteria bacterium]